MPVDKFGRMSDAKTRATGVSLTYINNNYIRSDGGSPVSGSIDMNGNTLYNVSDPVNPQDVATKEYADKVGGDPFFKKNGNYQAKNMINMAHKKLVNLRAPSEPFDAATKDYVDYVRETLKESLNNTIDKRPHMIAHYCGDLIKGAYQFTFGGNVSPELDTGFLVPHSGRIKKIQATNSRGGKKYDFFFHF